MRNKVWRPLNTWGIYGLGIAVFGVLVYTLLELSRVCSAL